MANSPVAATTASTSTHRNLNKVSCYIRQQQIAIMDYVVWTDTYNSRIYAQRKTIRLEIMGIVILQTLINILKQTVVPNQLSEKQKYSV